MQLPTLTSTQRAIFGLDSAPALREWLDRHLERRIGRQIDDITFEAGDIGAVIGLRLDDGTEVVVKALRSVVDLVRLSAVAECQRQLARSAYGCAAVIDGPAVTDGVTAVIEERLHWAASGTPHTDGARRSMAEALVAQIDLLRDRDGTDLLAGQPAWADWQHGAWPAPHDPIFDFSVAVPGFEFVDQLADEAAAVLRSARLPSVIGHSDWVWQNVCVRDEQFIGGYDWDSLICAPESVLVGLAAGIFSQGCDDPPDAPSAAEVEGFLSDYQTARGAAFGDLETVAARAAATWIRCYNARCQLDSATRRQLDAPSGSFVEQLLAERGH